MLIWRVREFQQTYRVIAMTVPLGYEALVLVAVKLAALHRSDFIAERIAPEICFYEEAEQDFLLRECQQLW